MTTVTISLPTPLAKKLDSAVQQEGFATRSEFVRNLLRKYFSPAGNGIQFETFIPKPLEEIEDNLRSTGKYNEKFIKSVIKGLAENSTIYVGKTS